MTEFDDRDLNSVPPQEGYIERLMQADEDELRRTRFPGRRGQVPAAITQRLILNSLWSMMSSCAWRRKMHVGRMRRLRLWHKVFATPSMILAALVASLLATGAEEYKVFTAFLSVAAAVITALANALKLEDQVQSHHSAATAYDELRLEAELLITLIRNDDDYRETYERLMKRYIEARKGAPLLLREDGKVGRSPKELHDASHEGGTGGGAAPRSEPESTADLSNPAMSMRAGVSEHSGEQSRTNGEAIPSEDVPRGRERVRSGPRPRPQPKDSFGEVECNECGARYTVKDRKPITFECKECHNVIVVR